MQIVKRGGIGYFHMAVIFYLIDNIVILSINSPSEYSITYFIYLD